MTSVLVAYASKHGSTMEIAEAIANTLSGAGLSVDCLAAGEVSSLESYDGVVLGSAVYNRRWQGEAERLLREHAGELSQRPLWAFSSGPVGEPKAHELDPPKTAKEVLRLGARGHVVLGGRLPTEPHGMIERSLVKHCPPEYRDRRDWEQIRAWAPASPPSSARRRPPDSRPAPGRPWEHVGVPPLTRWCVRAALVYLVGGMAMGPGAPWPVLHAHLLLVGFLLLLVFGVAFWMFPRRDGRRTAGTSER